MRLVSSPLINKDGALDVCFALALAAVLLEDALLELDGKVLGVGGEISG